MRCEIIYYYIEIEKKEILICVFVFSSHDSSDLLYF